MAKYDSRPGLPFSPSGDFLSPPGRHHLFYGALSFFGDDGDLFSLGDNLRSPRSFCFSAFFAPVFIDVSFRHSEINKPNEIELPIGLPPRIVASVGK